MVQLVTAALAMLCAAAMFAGLAHFRYKYKNNLSGPTSSPSSAVGPRRKEATGGGLAEKGVVRLWSVIHFDRNQPAVLKFVTDQFVSNFLPLLITQAPR